MAERLSREEGLKQLRAQRERLLAAIAELSEDERTAQPVVGDWSVRDILAHILAWEEEAVKRLKLIAKGTPERIKWVPPGKVDEWNAKAREKRLGMSLTAVLAGLAARREEISRLLRSLPEETLGDGAKVPLSVWLPNCTYKHEAEHAEQIEAWRRELETTEA